MDRITKKQLQSVIDLLNESFNGSAETHKKVDGRFYSIPGRFTLGQAYGGFCLQQYSNEGGAVHDVFYCGHVPARELWNRIQGYRYLVTAKERSEEYNGGAK